MTSAGTGTVPKCVDSAESVSFVVDFIVVIQKYQVEGLNLEPNKVQCGKLGTNRVLSNNDEHYSFMV